MSRKRSYQPNFQLDLLSAALQGWLDHRVKWESVITFARALGYGGAFILLLESRKEMIEYVAARTREVAKGGGGAETLNPTPAPAPTQTD